VAVIIIVAAYYCVTIIIIYHGIMVDIYVAKVEANYCCCLYHEATYFIFNSGLMHAGGGS
jgi:hypothetical protein